ncbi:MULTISPECIES: CBS domain-containing protein [Alteribacter]|uniref:CBS domain-containing protein n=1 Tax=Alteribacter keqinensis TaxID=2483800 RepID=A0A3M7TVX1_9BACI|nr:MULTISPECIES: CBS domain-containing protein [Alteribacter]MBM7095897.1 CBS domain-containing protein [Alteribacter salitolerans]RNA69718.1 CBS domain-containing protein [Alteribacter keqinensis]
MKSLRDVMTAEVECCKPDDNLYTAATKMKNLDVGAIPVCEGDHLLGMVTDRDIVLRGVAEKRPNSCEVKEVMSEHLITADSGMIVDQAAQMMAEKQIRRLPIVDGQKLVGIVSLGDLATHTSTTDEASFALNEISERPEAHH